MVSVLIAGGGTGGHVYPMLAVGEAVRAVDRDASVFYVGTARGLEAKAIPAARGDLELLDVPPLRGGGVRGFAKGVARAFAVLPEARRLVAKRRPDVVLSVGGYAAGPISLAARLAGVPVTLLEPNGVLGLSNRLLAPFVRRAYTAFGDLDRKFSKEKGRAFGVPLRSAFAQAAYSPAEDRFRVLVLGGSQGADHFNKTLPEVFARVVKEIPHATIIHQTGRGRMDDVKQAYVKLGYTPKPIAVSKAPVRVDDFIDDVAGQITRADVVLQRAGASSLAELCAIGRASVLVPFPFAADQHQLANARSLEKAGAAIAIEQRSADAAHLADALVGLGRDSARRVDMATAASALGRPRAARDIAEDLLALARERRV
jgi:UDP-N-acetylglucosamine--N-acetylmuramyl-(pentapeptide) pyrophosphoryl-undecaprenol N-acetylglucosamine transferase